MGAQASGIAEELKDEYGPNVSVTEDPAVGTSESSPGTTTPQEPVTPPATAEGETPAEGAPTAEGTSEEPASESSETPKEDPKGEEESSTEEISPDQAQALKEWGEGLVETAVTKIRDEEIPNIQRGLDSRITTLMESNRTMQVELDDANTKIRDASIKGLSDEDQAKMREGWANEDTAKGLDRYSTELDDMYVSVMSVQLINTYGQYGVTVEVLEGLEIPEDVDPVSVMTNFCKDRQIEALQKGTETTEQAPAKAEQQASSETPQKPPPAGAKAPSDVGGGGVPPAPVERDEGKGEGAMGNNIAANGWENAQAAFATKR